VWEGVTNYLSGEAVGRVLAFIGEAAAGTTILFTYIHSGVLDGSVSFAGALKLVRNVRRLGEPWTFGLRPDEVSAFVARYNLALEQDIGADDYRRRYLAGAARPRELRGYAFYRIAVAQAIGAGGC
jgi:O-methyltransferase involved in polyketide biosynthesis